MQLQHCLEPGQRLFVYGLLRRGMSAGLGTFIPGMAEFIGDASVVGQLYDVEGAYPALVVGEPERGGEGPSVTGELWCITDERAWPILDDFEGIGLGYPVPQLYRRRRVEARTASGSLSCDAYLYNRSVADLARVPSGDWARR